MLEQVWVLVCVLLIFIIFLRMPQENIGLSSFANKTDILGSPTSAQKSLNYITAFLVVIYFTIALLINVDQYKNYVV
jgi:protein translocase SecG subunit